MKGFLSVAVLAMSCATNRPIEYPFGAPDRVSVPGDGLNPGELLAEQRAELSIPYGVAAAKGRTSPDAGAPSLLKNGGRLLLVPGVRTLSFTATTTHEDGEEGRASWTVTQSFERGHTYKLVVGESDANVEWTLTSDNSAEVRPIDSPRLPLGMQADGSLVVAGEEQHGIPPFQISAPLFECPSNSFGLVDSTLTALHLAQACAAEDPDVIVDDSHSSWSFERMASFAGAVAACARDHFGARGRWSRQALTAPELCARVLGGDWRVPTRSEAQQISYLAKTADAQARSLDVLGRIYAIGPGTEVVEIDNSSAAAGWQEHKEAELRCIRSPMTAAPVAITPGRCPKRPTSASGGADSRPSPAAPRRASPNLLAARAASAR